MRYPLNPERLAHLLGMEEADVERLLRQLGEELEPYLVMDDEGQKQITVDGIPSLIKRMAFNIPTTEIIENLTCQVLHLAAIHEDYSTLEVEAQELRGQKQQLELQLAQLRQEVENLNGKLSDLANRGFRERLYDTFRHIGRGNA